MISSFESNPRRILSENGAESRKSYQNSQGDNQEISVDMQLIKQVSEFVRKNSCLVKSRRALNQGKLVLLLIYYLFHIYISWI